MDIDMKQYAVETLMALDRGAVMEQLGSALRRADQANLQHAAKAVVSLQLTVEPVKGEEHIVTISARITEKLPARPPKPMYLFRTADGRFSTRDERQPDFWEPKAVPATPADAPASEREEQTS